MVVRSSDSISTAWMTVRPNEKRAYCSFCALAPSEGAHVRPLGIPHNGPDTLDNILCLCPNCHVLFDGHALTIRSDGTIVLLDKPAGKLRPGQRGHQGILGKRDEDVNEDG